MMQTALIIQPLLAITLAPLLLGVINRVKAFFAGRRGQPLFQPYYDLWRLLHKGAVYSTAASWIFRAAPVVSLAAFLTAACIIPLGGVRSLFSFSGDLILAAYLFGLARFFVVLGALDTGSSFEGMGASREVHFSALAEPALFIALMALARQTSSLSLSGIFSSITPDFWTAHSATLLLVSAALAIVLLAENARIPVDDPNTHLELTMIHEVMVLDYSGPDFAFILYGSALKLWLYAALLTGAILPLGTLPPLAAAAVSAAAIFLTAVFIGIVESSMARLRLLRVPHLLFTAAALAILALVFALRS
ncbi:MAG TPA: NADH-quinone oxidoreductase subunit H [Anaerohalosphaeraceae bacterium]|nr:NADH-quinone oxidoreductase subunit H [Anaerohalosphaeraceae bacterium]